MKQKLRSQMEVVAGLGKETARRGKNEEDATIRTREMLY